MLPLKGLMSEQFQFLVQRKWVGGSYKGRLESEEDFQLPLGEAVMIPSDRSQGA